MWRQERLKVDPTQAEEFICSLLETEPQKPSNKSEHLFKWAESPEVSMLFLKLVIYSSSLIHQVQTLIRLRLPWQAFAGVHCFHWKYVCSSVSHLLLFWCFIVLECSQTHETEISDASQKCTCILIWLAKAWICFLLLFKVVGTVYLFHSDHPGETSRHARKSDCAAENSVYLISGNPAVVSTTLHMLLWFLGIFW